MAATRIQLRRGTTAEWAAADPVLAAGEPGVDLTTGQERIGNGSAPWSALPVSNSVAELSEAPGVTGTGPNLILGSAANRNGSAIAADVGTSVILHPGGPGGQNNIIGGNGAATVGTPTPNTTTPGTTANVSVVGGYDNVAGAISSKIISDHSYVAPSATKGHNAIYGGANNIVDGSGTGHAGIYSGHLCRVSADYAFAQGYTNTVSGIGARAMGSNNTVAGTYAAGLGNTNTASGAYARAAGLNCAATGAYSEATGNEAKATNFGQRARTATKLATQGDMQSSTWVCGCKTTTATQTLLGVGTGGPGYKLAETQSGAYSLLLVARDIANGDTKAWRVDFSAHREVGVATPAMTGVILKTVIAASGGAAAWDTAVVPIADNSLGLRVTGEAGKTIVWAGTMTCAEVMG